ncbi:hypothetical protein ABIF65_005654 [Bradyrhizobium japonicum]|jgi:hypothetical protein|nr:hypothetical protein [Bradyrhizobium japonicum]MCP1965431.1 hypothetical protein [Bradyrhizobium japonicum]
MLRDSRAEEVSNRVAEVASAIAEEGLRYVAIYELTTVLP